MIQNTDAIEACLAEIQGKYFQQSMEDLSSGYKLGAKLGRGNFGLVRLGKHIDTGLEVAVKELSKDVVKKYNDEERVRREAVILSKIEHPNVAYLYEILDEDQKYYFVMEKCEGGDLADFVAKNGHIGDKCDSDIAGEEE